MVVESYRVNVFWGVIYVNMVVGMQSIFVFLSLIFDVFVEEIVAAKICLPVWFFNTQFFHFITDIMF